MMPHLAEECWSLLGGKTSLVNVPWPEIREDYIVRDSVTIVVQINGKKRGEISLPPDASEEHVLNEALMIPSVNIQVKDKKIRKQIFVSNKILNLVI